jgi:type IV secretion system protein VirB4
MMLFHRLAALVDGRRLVVDIDAFREAPLGDGGFRGLVRDGLKTGHKQNAFMVFGTQSPAEGSRAPSLSNARRVSSQVNDVPKPSARAPIVPA